MCGRLNKALQGTRDAAQSWEYEYNKFMVDDLGFKRGLCSPCIFYHAGRQLYSSIHGDDLTTAGKKRDMDWFEGALEDGYELTKGGRLGPGAKVSKQGVILNRIIR